MTRPVTRRQFLVRTGWLAAGSTALTSCSSFLPVMPTFGDPEIDESCLWVQALPDGRVRFLCPKSEMGQGVTTGLAQIVGEELNLPASRIEVVVPDTDAIPPAAMTVGSMSIERCFEPLSIAAATLRESLRERCASERGLRAGDVADLGDGEGGFRLPDGTAVSYAEIAGEGASIVEADPSRAGDGIACYARDRGRGARQIGRRWPRTGAEAIVRGEELYSRDSAVPGMLFGRVLHEPWFGARLDRMDEAAARGVRGVVATRFDRAGNRAGVVADDPFALERGVAALAPVWTGGQRLGQDELDRLLDVEKAIADDDFEHTASDEGDLDAGREAAARTISVRYDSPFLQHAPMEPRAAVVSVTDDGVEVWSASQDPWYVRGSVARITGHRAARVKVHNHRLGGAFGGRSRCQAAEEAAWLSAHVHRPVKVQWTREDEFRHNYFQPRFSHRIDAGIDADGHISFWSHDFTSNPVLMSSAMIPEHLYWAVDIPADPGTGRNAIPPYALPAHRIRYSDIRVPVQTGPWRGLGAAPNTFAVESAMDELAAEAGQDPVEFRVRHLPPGSERLEAVLRRVVKMSDFGAPTPKGVGRGIACTRYKEGTMAAVVVEVRIDGAQVRATRAWCAHDCGLVINPDQVEAQVEGNLIWGISMALREGTEVADGHPVCSNFHDYAVLRHGESPEIEVELIVDPRLGPYGAGEPAIAPTPAAVANAVFAATGRRARRLPIRLA